MKRTHYIKEFKIQVCKQAINVGNTANIARQYELCPKMVNRWVKEFKEGKYYGTDPLPSKEGSPGNLMELYGEI
ncbi:transposase [Bacillus sp. EB600]|uniref:transposase n=1 Tax=Bacillus sp. EB600 TaxID=2806345 RepID=UPI00210B7E3B|nr:transposase [Bacillus sp. EB600]MCQ6282373.1 transposase [Bacillus sp. EB600]